MTKIGLMSLVFLLVSFFSEYAFACSCQEHPTVKDTVDNTKIIFVATSLGSVENKDGAPYSQRALTTLAVRYLFKGNLKKTVILHHTKGSGAACGINFREGQTYLVFAYRDDDGNLSSSLCSKGYWYNDLHYLRYLTMGWNAEHPSIKRYAEIEREIKLEKLANDPWEMKDIDKDCGKADLKPLKDVVAIVPEEVKKINDIISRLSPDEKSELVFSFDEHEKKFTQNVSQDKIMMYILNQAAREGSIPAIQELGAAQIFCYQGVKQNIPSAITYITKAEAGGDVLAMETFARLNLSGYKMPKNEKKGIEYLEKCSVLNHKRCDDLLEKIAFMEANKQEISKYKNKD